MLACGPEDPRLCEIDDEFRDVVLALNFMPKVSRVERKRFVHRNATTARGVFEVVDHPDFPLDVVAKQSKLVLDTKGVLRQYPFTGETL